MENKSAYVTIQYGKCPGHCESTENTYSALNVWTGVEGEGCIGEVFRRGEYLLKHRGCISSVEKQTSMIVYLRLDHYTDTKGHF